MNFKSDNFVETKKNLGLEELKKVSFELAQTFVLPQLVLLDGILAVGKTQMVKYMLMALGENSELVNSPTFSLINDYSSKAKRRIYHVDLYRIQSDKELEEIAFWDLFYEEGLVFIEWPERVKGQLPPLWNKIYIELEFSHSELKRNLKWKRLK